MYGGNILKLNTVIILNGVSIYMLLCYVFARLLGWYFTWFSDWDATMLLG